MDDGTFNENLSGYELSRDWFDWCFEHSDEIRPTHTALYFFAIEHCNRLGWKKVWVSYSDGYGCNRREKLENILFCF